ncbi:WD40 repeat domain-containing serine/threonine protein kinase [Rhodopirellula halodulae]|uniref:WD40 repeat domain-containing serine/threonine protein kinase n=1 Tax=Rhodopirellula halodulae TaxID=2894198 RepID=UPI001E61451D|nr:WD40 repeat domain-containing serine/threonine protein kinase [Rhodopirellula sp. JC737]MCC9655510.1 WD40 repeat domain-containing serine/threonine protein kinase [Rhodopirellula sp. JC737]
MTRFSEDATQTTNTESEADSFSDSHFGKYRILRALGSGGMGDVYLGEDTTSGKQVALKLIRLQVADNLRLQRRFSREASVVQELNHEHVVPLLDSGVQDGMQFLVMRYINGITLAERIMELNGIEGSESFTLATRKDTQDSPPSTAERRHDSLEYIAKSIADIADALHSAHQQRIIHRDVKPSNLMIDEQGKIWLTDFGLAFNEEDNTALTMTGHMVGTPSYMSPEQTSGSGGQATAQSDIYSLGVTLYEWITQHRAFSGSRDQILNRVAQGTHLPARAFRENLPRSLEAILFRSMATSPKDRYQTAAELAADLRRFANHEAVAAKLPGWSERLYRWSERNPLVALAALIGTVTTIVAVIATITIYSGRLMRINATLADTNEELSLTNAELNSSRSELQRQLYVADMTLAYQAYESHNLPEARKLLLKYHPDTEPEFKKTHFAWRHLERLTRPQESVLLTRHEPEAREVAVSDDGTLALSVGHDGMVHVIDLVQQKVIRKHEVGEKLCAIAISPDKKSFVTGTNTSLGINESILCDVETGTVEHAFLGHLNSIESAAFSADGKLFATAERYRKLFVFSVDGEKVAEFDSESRNECLEFVGDTNEVAAVWRIPGRHDLLRVSVPTDGVAYDVPSRGISLAFATAILPEIGVPRFAICDFNAIRVVDGKDQRLVAYLDKLPSHIRDADLSADGRYLALGTDEGLLYFWDLNQTNADRQLFHTTVIQASDSGISSVAIVPNGDQIPKLISTCLDGDVRLWDLSKQLSESLDFHDQNKDRSFAAYTFRHPITRSKIYTRAFDGHLWLYDHQRPETKLVKLCHIPIAGLFNVAVSNDGLQAATISEKDVLITDLETGLPVHKIQPYDPKRECIDFRYTSDSLCLLYHDRLRVYSPDEFKLQNEIVFDGEGFRQLHNIPGDHSALLVKRQNQLLLYRDGKVTLLEQCDLSNAYHNIQFSDDGKLIAMYQRGRTFRVKKFPSQEQISLLRGFRANPHSLAFLDEGRTLMTAMSDKTVRFWDLETEREMGRRATADPTVDGAYFFASDDKLLLGNINAPAIILEGNDRPREQQTASK